MSSRSMPFVDATGRAEWLVPRGEDSGVLYVVRHFTETTGEHHLITVHTLNTNQIKKNGGFSDKKVPPSRLPPETFGSQAEIPDGELTRSTIEGRTKADANSRSSAGQEAALYAGNLRTGLDDVKDADQRNP